MIALGPKMKEKTSFSYFVVSLFLAGFMMLVWCAGSIWPEARLGVVMCDGVILLYPKIRCVSSPPLTIA